MESNLSTRAKTWLGISAIPIILYSIVPILWMLSLSLKPSSDQADGKFIPSEISWSNYSLILTGGAKDLFLPALANSIVVCLSATVISVVLATFAAYALVGGAMVLLAIVGFVQSASLTRESAARAGA